MSSSSKLCKKSDIELILEKQRIEFRKETNNRKNIKNILVIGNKSDQKNWFCNQLCGETSSFKDYNDSSKFSQRIECKVIPHQNCNLCIIDTIGIEDSLGDGTFHYWNMYNYLQEINYINAIICVFRNAYWDEFKKSMFIEIQRMTNTNTFLNNIIFVFNNHENEKETTYQKINAYYNQKAKNIFNAHSTKIVPCFYTNSFVKKDNKKVINQIKDYMINTITINCNNFNLTFYRSDNLLYIFNNMYLRWLAHKNKIDKQIENDHENTFYETSAFGDQLLDHSLLKEAVYLWNNLMEISTKLWINVIN